MYTAVLFMVDPGGTNQTFSLSRQVGTDDKRKVVKFMMKEAKTKSKESVDTILLMRNGPASPEVFQHWTAANGDFE